MAILNSTIVRNLLNDFFSDLPNSGKIIPAVAARAITPSDSEELAEVSRSLFVGATGTVVMKLRDDEDAVTYELIGGMVYPFQVRQVLFTGTDVSLGLVALY